MCFMAQVVLPEAGSPTIIITCDACECVSVCVCECVCVCGTHFAV